MPLDISIDLGTVRRYREELRRTLPDLMRGRASNETLSACVSMLSEASLYRIVSEIQKLRGTEVQKEEALALMEELTRAFSEALSKVVLQHVPDATFLRVFKGPEHA